jgi:NAD(P)-dependent dehydrogenase (short-subunit alcohol dehydrogenase family)
MDRRSVAVVGGGSGIGAACAQLLAQRGWEVTAGDVRFAASGPADGVVQVEADATSPEDMARLVDRADGRAPLRGLVYSAGIERHGSAVTTEPAVWDEMQEVNLKGAYLAARAAVPVMAAHGGGAVVVLSSVQGIATQKGVAAYAAAKAGALGLVRAMALDHAAEGIRVNAVAPGTIDTPLVRQNAAEMTPTTPSGRCATGRTCTLSAGSAGRRRSPPWWPSCSRRRRPSSPAPPGWSTEV